MKQLVLEVLPDEDLMRVLERERGNGRDDYPIRPMWNSLLAGIVYQHESVESLRRELERNGDLLRLCGFEITLRERAVPPSWVYSRFLAKLLKKQEYIDGMIDQLVEGLKEELPDFGQRLGTDSKGIRSRAKRRPKKRKRDGRRDTDADLGIKTYRGQRDDGTLWEKVVRWFGYKLHLLADVTYELPVGYEVTRASASDTTRLLPMMQELKERHPEIVERAGTLVADRGYDSTENNRELWDRYGIKPVIAKREMWKDGEGMRPLYEDRADNILYDEDGGVYCCCKATGEIRQMAFKGFEKERGTLKYQCLMSSYGLECEGRLQCGAGNYGPNGRIARVPLARNRRLFTPLARSSYAFKRAYKKRTAVERINSRMDVSFGFEHHYIRGLKKMRLRCGLAIMVMLAMALGRVKQKKEEYMRSLVKIPRAA